MVSLDDIRLGYSDTGASLVAQLVTNPEMWKTWVRSQGWEDPLEKGKATLPVFRPRELHRLYSPWGCKESVPTERLFTHTHTHTHTHIHTR